MQAPSGTNSKSQYRERQVYWRVSKTQALIRRGHKESLRSHSQVSEKELGSRTGK